MEWIHKKNSQETIETDLKKKKKVSKIFLPIPHVNFLVGALTHQEWFEVEVDLERLRISTILMSKVHDMDIGLSHHSPHLAQAQLDKLWQPHWWI